MLRFNLNRIMLKPTETKDKIIEAPKLSDFFGVLIDIDSDEIIKIIKESHKITSKNNQQPPK
jgi:hypothetical protein